MNRKAANWASRRTNSRGRTLLAAAVFSLGFSFGSLASAQELPAADPSSSPARAVRLSSVDGQVQLSQGNQVLATQAPVNTPLFEGTQVSTSDDGRAEVQFEDGSVVRISPNSSLTLATLRQEGNSGDTEVVLNSGLAYFEIQGDSQAKPIRVRFANNLVTTSGFTVVRVNLDYPPGAIAVFSGNAHVEGGNSLALDLHGGESVQLNDPQTGNYVLSETIEPDSWDTWNSDRDQALTAQEANRTAATASVPNSSNPAWSDLDANGNWYNVPGQGYVWSPYAASATGWDPYGCGSWMWTPNFGYIWVSCESWGYMPYATGSWGFYDGLGWGWAPGIGVPWWGGGGWGFNIGNHPFRYLPPHRPRGEPVHPGGGGGIPIHAGGRYQPYPVVAVNRVHGGPVPPSTHVGAAPVTIAGNTLQPLRPISRPVYGQPANGFRGGTGNVGAYPLPRSGVHYGTAPVTIPNGARPGAWNPPSGTYRPPAPAYRPPVNTYRPPVNVYHPQAPQYSAPSRPSFSAPPAPSHPSGGGGGSAPHGGGAHR